MEQLDVRQSTVELETTPFLPVLEPVSKPTQTSETTEPSLTTAAPGPRSEGCLLAGARREIHPSSSEWSTPTGRELIAQGVKIETDMLICDKRALVPLSGDNCSLSYGFGGKM